MKKRGISLLMVLVLCMGLTVPAMADMEANQGGQVSGADTYQVNSDGTATIGAFSNQSALRQFTCRSRNVQISGSNVFYGVYDCTFYGYPDSIFQQYVDAMPKTYQKQVTDIKTYTVKWVDNPTNNTFQSLSSAPAAETGTQPAAPSFTDVTATAYYSAPVQWAVAEGITTASTFSPNSTCTRARIVTFLYRAFAD